MIRSHARRTHRVSPSPWAAPSCSRHAARTNPLRRVARRSPPPIGGAVVVATTSIWADITANVACDGLADVRTIIPPGGDPHSFEPSLRDRETLDDADLIVANGLSLEESLEDTIDAVESGGVPVLRVGDGLDPIPTAAASHDDRHTRPTTTITATPTRTSGGIRPASPSPSP